MGDQLEKFIIENRESFDEASPSDQLWNRIDRKLEKKHASFHLAWRVAAVLFLASTIYLLIENRQQNTSGPQLSEEFVQAEDHYLTMINQRRQLIKEELAPEQEQQFLADINQLDLMYKELKKTYQTNASNERVVDAMINNLQLRLDILNRQLEILENIKNQKDETELIIEI